MKRYKLEKTGHHDEIYNIKDTETDELFFIGEVNERLNNLEEENKLLKQQVQNYEDIIGNGREVIKLLNKKISKLEKLLLLRKVERDHEKFEHYDEKRQI